MRTVFSGSMCLLFYFYITQNFDAGVPFKEMQQFVGHTDAILCVSAGDGFIFTGGDDRTAKQWDIETGKCIRTFVGHVGSINDVCIGAGYLFTASADYTAKKWEYARIAREDPFVNTEYQSMQPWNNEMSPRAKTPGAPSMRTSPGPMERRRLVGLLQSSGELGAEVTDLGTFGGDPQSAPYNKRSNETFGGTRGHIFSVKCVEVKNNLLYTGSLDETVREWDIERCQCLREFEIEAMMYGMCLYHDWVFTSSVGDRSEVPLMCPLNGPIPTSSYGGTGPRQLECGICPLARRCSSDLTLTLLPLLSS